VIRTVIEVSGQTSFKPFPKTTAGRRTVPLPGWLVTLLREHLERYPRGEAGLVFANQVGGAYRRTLFRTRVWRPALVRAGLLGLVEPDGGKFCGEWTDAAGGRGSAIFDTEPAAVKHVVRQQAAGLRFHDLRHSYATWLVDDGVPVNMVQRVLGHERSSTTLDLYTREPMTRPVFCGRSTMTIRRMSRRVLWCLDEDRGAFLVPFPPIRRRALVPETTKTPCPGWSGGRSGWWAIQGLNL
jgi:integrase